MKSGLQIRGSKFRSSSSKFRELELQNFRVRSRLYRSQILQVNTRWKALAEIYTMHSFAPFSNRKIFVKNCWKFCCFFCKFSQNLPKFAEFLLNFGQILAKFFRDFSKMQHLLKIAGKSSEVRWSSQFQKKMKFWSSVKFEVQVHRNPYLQPSLLNMYNVQPTLSA